MIRQYVALAMINIQALDSERFADWDAFVEANHSEKFFSLSSWLDATARLNDSEPTIIACDYRGEVVGGIAGVMSHRFGLKIFEPPPLTPYNGVLVGRNLPGSIDPSVIPGTIFRYAKNVCGRLILSSFPESALGGLPGELHLNVTKRYTSVIDLSSETDILRGFKPDVRNKINKANRAGVEVVEKFAPDAFYPLLSEVYQKAKLKPRLDKKDFCDSLIDIHRRGWLRMFFAGTDEGDMAAMAILQHEGIAYSWLSATAPAHYGVGVGPKLTSEILDVLRADGVGRFDFMGVNLPGVGRYKESFGGQKIDYTAVDVAYSARGRAYRYLQSKIGR